MSALEKIREHPARFGPPWAATLARPAIGAKGVYETRQGNWGKGELYLGGAWLSDFIDGKLARFLHATSKAGAAADPAMDGVLRAESLVALAPEMPIAVAAVTAIEIYNIKLNSTVQKGREKPFVPWIARAGTFVEGSGFIWAMEGVRTDRLHKRVEGKVAMLAGAGLRCYGYRKEYKRMQNKEVD